MRLDPATVTLVLGILGIIFSIPAVRNRLNKPRKATNLEERVDGLERRERVILDYVEELRVHISTGKPPPPPDWPEALTRPSWKNYSPPSGDTA